MPSCFPLHLLRSSRKKQRKLASQPPPSRLDILAHPEHANVWRAAIPSFDHTTDEAVVSRELVTEVLTASDSIMPLDKEMRSGLRKTDNVNGYIILRWRPMNGSEREFKTLFYVSSEEHPRFDVVLGREGVRLLES